MGRIFVTGSVAAGVMSGLPADPTRQWHGTTQGADCVVPDTAFTIDSLAWDLGAGQTAVIAMARANPGYEALFG